MYQYYIKISKQNECYSYIYWLNFIYLNETARYKVHVYKSLIAMICMEKMITPVTTAYA